MTARHESWDLHISHTTHPLEIFTRPAFSLFNGTSNNFCVMSENFRRDWNAF